MSTRKKQTKTYLGTSRAIKLPYIIGSSEFGKHPFAGLVYMGDDELEQLDLHQEEVDQLLEDENFEKAKL